jgi:hypothetical protein
MLSISSSEAEEVIKEAAIQKKILVARLSALVTQ